MKLKLTVPFLLVLILCFSCKPKSNKKSTEDFKIMILADTQTSDDENKYQRLENMLDRVNKGEFPGVDFVAVSGDFVSAVFGNDTLSENRLLRTVGIFKKLTVPYYSAMGNHDYKLTRNRDSDAPYGQNEILKMENIWKNHTGFDPYFALKHKGWNFIFLNSMRGRYLKRAFDDEQMQWYRTELEKGLPSILIFHHPIETDHYNNWGKAKDLITEKLEPEFYAITKSYQKQIKGIFVGHGHSWITDDLFGTIKVHETKGFADSEQVPVYTIVDVHTENQDIEININTREKTK